MKKRCLNPNATGYSNYGGRGITVCDRWINSFEAFHQDMGDRPEGMSIDRIDNNGNYEPGNCRWATNEEQQRNKRDRPLRLITVNGEHNSIAGWARKIGIDQSAIHHRLRRGWPIELAVTAAKGYRP